MPVEDRHSTHQRECSDINQSSAQDVEMKEVQDAVVVDEEQGRVAPSGQTSAHGHGDTEQQQDHDQSHTVTMMSEEPKIDDEGQAGFNSQTNYVNKATIITIFLSLSVVTFTIVLDQTTLSVAAPIIGTELNAGDRTSFITASYFLTSTSFQMIYGRVSDFFGRKPLLMVLLVIFFIGSLGSSLSPEVISLVVFRALTGIAGGGLLTIGQFVIGDVVSLRDRGTYQGILGTIIVAGNGIGPLAGGALAQEASWRDIYRMMLPLIALAFAISWKFLPLKRVEGDWKKKAAAVDWFGCALSFVAVALVVLGLSWAGGSYAWSDAHVLAPLIIGIFFFVFFILWQWKGCTDSRPPLLPLSMFRHRVVIGAAITQFTNGFLMYAQLFYLPQFYQLVYAYSAIKAGALILPLLCVQSFSSTMSGLIVSKTGRYRELLLSGWSMWAVGLGLISTLNDKSGLGKQIGYTLLTGIGVGQTLQIALIALQSAVPRNEMAVVTGLRNFARNLGGALGLAIGASIVNTVTINDLAPLGWSATQVRKAIAHPADLFSQSPQTFTSGPQLTPTQIEQLRTAYARGFKITFILLAALAAFSFVVTLFLMRHRNIDREDDELLRQRAKKEMEEKQERKKQDKLEKAGARREG